MSLLWIDGFDGKTAQLAGLYSGTSNQATYVTGRFSPGFALYGVNSGSTWDEYVRTIGTTTTLYTGFAFFLGQSANGFESSLLNLYSGGSVVLQLRVNGSNLALPGQLRVYTTAQLGITSTGVPAPWHFIEMKVVCGTGTSGSVIVRQNGVETLNLTGVNTGSASVDKIGLRLGSATNTAGCSHTVDDWYVCDQFGSINNNFMGDIRVVNLVPTGAGTTTQLTPSTGANWDCVNEVPPVTTDYVSSATPGNYDLYAYSDLAYADIRGVKVTALAVASDAGAIKGRNRVYSATTSQYGADNTLGATAQGFADIIEKDPNTSSQWTTANLNAAQFGWEVRS